MRFRKSQNVNRLADMPVIDWLGQPVTHFAEPIVDDMIKEGKWMGKKVLAFDFGASSGRAMLGTFDGKQIQMEEIHRFSNDPVVVCGHMYWDILRLFHEVKQSITKAVALGGFDAVGIDTWGVDFGLLSKKGELLQNPLHYRDARTHGVPEKLFETVGKEELYSRTGIQYIHFNTIYQFYYLIKEEPELWNNTDQILMIPDLMAYFLTGQKRIEVTNASTTNLLNPYTKEWDQELCEKLGISTEKFPPLIEAGESYGNLSEEICEELGCKPVPVIAVATHDTASAVVSAPAKEKDFIYISCGTWSLFGTELSEPLINEDTSKANYTNETGIEKTTRFLKNIMGLWLIQESRRQWKREGEDVSFAQLEQEALAAKPFQCFVDVDDPSFEPAGNLPRRVVEYCQRTGQYVPKTRGEIMRCIYDSLAMKYKVIYNVLQELTGKHYESIHMLGGGIKDTLLCRMTASATGAKVIAGPAEATVTGNIAVQYMALGEIKGLNQAREVIRNSTQLKEYGPEEKDVWEREFPRYQSLMDAK